MFGQWDLAETSFVVLIAGMLISLNAALIFGFMSIILGLGMAIAQTYGFAASHFGKCLMLILPGLRKGSFSC